ncbi:MAG: hypothetical protein JWM43_912 [Acidobacteriaceae bacterium]|nr:hypothetical protein [Acidobacteriaceae bacterium]
MRLRRTFSLPERFKVEGIAEAFNALNHRYDALSQWYLWDRAI